MSFDGFTEQDFAVFEIPGFAARMPALKGNITPKLKELGEDLTPRLSEALGQTLFPHVAQHLRRSVNAPVETWVAFSPSARAYKPFVHMRAAISADKVRVVVFVEDYADDKALFAENLIANAETLATTFDKDPTIRAYDIRDGEGEPLHGAALDTETVRSFGERLKRLKGQHAAFGIPFAHTHPVVLSGPQLTDAIIEAAVKLKPLYACGYSAAVPAGVP